MTALHWDFETRSDVDLGKTGTEVYATGKNTSATMAAGAFGDEDIFGFLIDPYTHEPKCPPELWARIVAHVREGKPVVAHNMHFELLIWDMLRARRPDIWPALKPEQTFCTMALCHAMSLPGKLEKAALALRLHVEKDMIGHALMKKLCKPRKPKVREGEDPNGTYWHEDPAEILRELAYCKSDIPPEREIFKRLLPLSDREREYWLIDWTINQRGLPIDLANAAICETAAARTTETLNAEIFALTGGAVKTPKSQKLKDWLREQGCALPNLQRPTIDRAMEAGEGTLPDHIMRALEIKQEASKASVAKLKTMRLATGADGRARGLLTYHGAGTGRPAGRRIQPTNMPRTPDEFKVEHAEDVYSWLATPGGEAIVAAQYGTVLDGISWSLRPLVKAAPGYRFLAADYSNIEGRMQAWLAGEKWKLDAFRAYDTLLFAPDGSPLLDKKGKHERAGPDLYVKGYSESFNVPIDAVTPEQRQNLGKVGELLLQFGGAHGAVLNMLKAGARKYRWNGVQMGKASSLEELTAAVQAASPPDMWEDALLRYWKGAHESAEEVLEARRLEMKLRQELWGEEPDEFEPDFFDVMRETQAANRHKLAPEPWAAIRIFVDKWRAANPAICKFWKALEKAAIEAVENPETVIPCGKISYLKSGDFLLCRLPSSRKIAYPYPRVKIEMLKRKRRDGSEYEIEIKKLFYEGFDAKKRWGLQYAYGGMLSENVTQAAARCVQSDSQHRLEAAGYPVVLHVYDENVVELPEGKGTLEEMCQIMAQLEPWAEGLPVSVAGWAGERYRK